MDKKGQPLSEKTFICDLAFPNATNVIMSSLVTDQLQDKLLIEAMENLGFADLAATAKPLGKDTKINMLKHMLASNQPDNVRTRIYSCC